jgi:hypothetical protein
MTQETQMRQTDRPGPFESSAGPGAGRPDPGAARTLDLDPGPVLRFAQELGRLLGEHWARAGFPPDEAAAPRATAPNPRRRPASR